MEQLRPCLRADANVKKNRKALVKYANKTERKFLFKNPEDITPTMVRKIQRCSINLGQSLGKLTTKIELSDTNTLNNIISTVKTIEYICTGLIRCDRDKDYTRFAEIVGEQLKPNLRNFRDSYKNTFGD